MVGTLIKHEALRTRGLLATIFGAATLLTVVGALISATGWPLIAQFGLVLALVGTAGILPATQLGLAVDYWQSGYRRIGYFTQTLPVRGRTIYWAKLVWGLVAVLASIVWALVLAAITFMGNASSLGFRPFDVFGLVGDWLAQVAAVLPWWGWAVAPLVLLVLVMFTLLQYYFAASIGSEKRFNSMGVGGPIAVWFLLYVVLQLVILAFLVIPVGLGVEGGSLALVNDNYLQMLLTNTDPGSVPIGFVPGFLVASLVLIWRTVISWDHKVSLV